MFSGIISFFKKNPKTLFLIDAMGALITTLILFIIQSFFLSYFGFLKTVFQYLILLGLLLFLCSSSCTFFLKEKFAFFLRGIAFGNLFYCCLTFVIIYFYYSILSPIGIIYFASEIATISILVFIELQVARGLQ
ncbi:MAG TPA: hypothetical protein PK079_22400 [Leptospiraceae bacterium]|nr:hypothetical protein [Leptospiraceae bacterium]HMW08532.1 hypothetical protein [Leptospiraceae bacterium]HMX34869.1 hypothetical protein [Leptospiraceae bacterium]HMY34219.1 hypothetical protein [Leptospiraceae bacterium]HMZ66529.1 hypothetical protein [Leptospiraceae bacterium]